MPQTSIFQVKRSFALWYWSFLDTYYLYTHHNITIKVCSTHIATGTCPYGKKCVFLHDPRLNGPSYTALKTKYIKVTPSKTITKDCFYYPGSANSFHRIAYIITHYIVFIQTKKRNIAPNSLMIILVFPITIGNTIFQTAFAINSHRVTTSSCTRYGSILLKTLLQMDPLPWRRQLLLLTLPIRRQ